jgi:hypothetical protein
MDDENGGYFCWDQKYEYFSSGAILEQMVTKNFRENLLRLDTVLSSFSNSPLKKDLASGNKK